MYVEQFYASRNGHCIIYPFMQYLHNIQKFINRNDEITKYSKVMSDFQINLKRNMSNSCYLKHIFYPNYIVSSQKTD